MYYRKELFDKLDRQAMDREGEIALIRELAAHFPGWSHGNGHPREFSSWRSWHVAVLSCRHPPIKPILNIYLIPTPVKRYEQELNSGE